MKRFLALVILIMFINTTVFAEATTFSFQDKVKWGATKQDVIAAYGDSNVSKDELSPDNLKMSQTILGFSADVTFSFIDNKLVAISTKFDYNDASKVFAQAKTGLTIKYGDSVSIDQMPIYQQMKDIDPDSTSSIEQGSTCGWVLEDVQIILMADSLSEDQSTTIAYFEPNYVETFLTSGL